MKILKQTFLAVAMVIGITFAVSAQGDDQKKTPKKPPVIVPGDKKPRGNPPPRETGPKKPTTGEIASMGERRDA